MYNVDSVKSKSDKTEENLKNKMIHFFYEIAVNHPMC